MPTEPHGLFWRKIAVCGIFPQTYWAPANRRVPQGQAVEPVPSERELAVFDQVGRPTVEFSLSSATKTGDLMYRGCVTVDNGAE